jgi:hypothetical protein
MTRDFLGSCAYSHREILDHGRRCRQRRHGCYEPLQHAQAPAQ